MGGCGDGLLDEGAGCHKSALFAGGMRRRGVWGVWLTGLEAAKGLRGMDIQQRSNRATVARYERGINDVGACGVIQWQWQGQGQGQWSAEDENPGFSPTGLSGTEDETRQGLLRAP